MATTLRGMVSAFLSTRRLRNLSPNTITFYSQHLNKFLEFMESHYSDVSLEQIDHTILREYVSGIKENHSPYICKELVDERRRYFQPPENPWAQNS